MPALLPNDLFHALREWCFPGFCAGCADRLDPGLHALCVGCRFDAFSYSAREWLILPQSIRFIAALWNFDKGGGLQDLLHRLKYAREPGIGVELGECIGQQLLPGLLAAQGMAFDECWLLPVPIHPGRKRRRGYNQAERIACGIAGATGIGLCPEGLAVRVRNTRSQTGLTESDRARNMRGVFRITDPERFKDVRRDRFVLIVDDVVTTGATVFALSDLLLATCGDSIEGRIGAVGVASG